MSAQKAAARDDRLLGNKTALIRVPVIERGGVVKNYEEVQDNECFRGGYSTSTKAVNNFVKNAYIYAEVKAVFRKKLNIKTSNVHKELTTNI